MKNYTKTHKNQKAAASHSNKIKKRGGVVTVRKTKSGTVLDYKFPKSKQKELF